MPSTAITMPLPPRFDLVRAVCSYGYYALAPNRWDAATATLSRPLHDARGGLIHMHIRQGKRLTIRCERAIGRDDAAAVRSQVARMLRLNEDFTAFHKLHPAARKANFGCLFRSPTLFEDIVKTFTTCNVAWSSTRRMNELLCDRYGNGGFPTPDQLAKVPAAELKQTCRVGYRADRIIRLARQVTVGELDLSRFERQGVRSAELFDELRQIHGIGPYAAGNMLQLLGHYDRLAIDSETYRHFREVYNAPTPKSAADLRKLHVRIERHYAPFKPYQYLAYWFELWHRYQL